MKKLFFVVLSALVACSQSPTSVSQKPTWESAEFALPHSDSATVMGLVTIEEPNHLLVEGDILVPRVNKTLSAQAVSFDPAYSSRLWTDAKVYYLFDTNLGQIGRNNFLEAAKRVEASTAIRFFERSNQANYIRVWDNGSTSACNSSVGMVGGEQRMSLGCIKNSATEGLVRRCMKSVMRLACGMSNLEPTVMILWKLFLRISVLIMLLISGKLVGTACCSGHTILLR